MFMCDVEDLKKGGVDIDVDIDPKNIYIHLKHLYPPLKYNFIISLSDTSVSTICIQPNFNLKLSSYI